LGPGSFGSHQRRALTIFCMIDLLVSLAVTLTFPGFSETIEALQQYF
jgi:hypothetical protein